MTGDGASSVAGYAATEKNSRQRNRLTAEVNPDNKTVGDYGLPNCKPYTASGYDSNHPETINLLAIGGHVKTAMRPTNAAGSAGGSWYNRFYKWMDEQ
ncbi:hypothetical protein SDC9_138883 [bioreactor metagenome]|uniref:Uncharacterized protein n=1 Tax=bioreactor metagenome TaxID=1076179 RepID=A0A645DR65_9ZZZZ